MSRDDSEGWRFDTEEVEDEEASEEPVEEGDDGWRFTLEDLEDDDAVAEPAEEGDSDHQSAVGGNVFGSMDSDTDVIQAGRPRTENALFVALGVVVALLVFAQFFLLFT